MVHKQDKLCSKVLKHLKGDSETWKELSKKADEEYQSDVKLMKKIKKVE